MRLRSSWQTGESGPNSVLERLLDGDALSNLDLFDRLQLEGVLRASRRCRTLSEAGRLLFARSRDRKANPNDADRVRKYLARFGLEWEQVRSRATAD